METQHTDLFRIVLMLNCFVLFLSFTGVRSAVSKPNIMDIMKNDPQLCPTSKFLYDSEYTKSCASIAYPTDRWNYNPDTLNNFLCLGVNDTAYKICQYSSQLQNFLNSTATFNSYVEKYVPNNKTEDQEAFCNKLQGFTSLYNKTDSVWGQLVTDLNKPHKCVRICFDFKDKFHPLCAVFAWIKNIEDIQRAKKIEIKQDSSDKPHINQLKDEMNDIKIIPTESKKTSEANTQNRKQITADSNINNNVKEGDANVPDNILANESNGEKTKSDTEKTSNIQQKINNTLEIPAKSVSDKSVPSTFKENKEYTIDTELETNAKVAKPIKDIPPNSDSQAPSINNDINNINKKVVNEKNTEKSNKEQDTDDFKTSTLSENTQDHYDGNPENIENIENDIDDIDETPHPDTGNQNENVQGTFEQKNNNARLTEYSDAKTEDDSHFFTYFTVITLACLAGYIGYHNKQKILAIVLEGRRSRSNRGRRRPSTASYRKLDCTLEEAVTSQCNANVTHVIY